MYGVLFFSAHFQPCINNYDCSTMLCFQETEGTPSKKSKIKTTQPKTTTSFPQVIVVVFYLVIFYFRILLNMLPVLSTFRNVKSLSIVAERVLGDILQLRLL